MGEKTTVAFRVDESVKQEWQEAADRAEYDSLSHLIRLAVQKEITDTETERRHAQTGVELESEILESLNRLENSVEEVQEEVGAVGREQQAGEMYELEQVLLEILPVANVDWSTDNPRDGLEIDPARPSDIAERIGADSQRVSDALNRLADNTGQVKRTQVAFDDQPGYWRVE
jgi:antitoxin component of RelBE/YafQ-DinJ toxin-antitoxin module